MIEWIISTLISLFLACAVAAVFFMGVFAFMRVMGWIGFWISEFFSMNG